MGSPNELAEVPPRNDGAITPTGSKAESVNMDLYINPAAERKMMLKFDVSRQVLKMKSLLADLPRLVSPNILTSKSIHDGKRTDKK